MAEIGPVRFAQLTVEVGDAVSLTCRNKFSKRLFTQPELLAVLCPMRYEDWIFRKLKCGS